MVPSVRSKSFVTEIWVMPIPMRILLMMILVMMLMMTLIMILMTSVIERR